MECIGDLADIPDPGTLEFSYSDRQGEQHGVIVKWQGHIRAYRNSCPHMGVSLNWQENQFFDMDNLMLQCSMHGALFQPLDGLCVWGPCRGQSLGELRIQIESGKVWLCE